MQGDSTRNYKHYLSRLSGSRENQRRALRACRTRTNGHETRAGECPNTSLGVSGVPREPSQSARDA